MSFQKSEKQHIENSNSTGFGVNTDNYGGRLVNKDGTPNVKREGVSFLERFSWFHTMLSMNWIKFFVIILFFYIIVNLIFTFIYLVIGVENLIGVKADSFIEKFYEAFFFSTQTFTTVGYGRISPIGFAINVVSSLQALVGLLSFAVATGLMYGRFSLPKAYLKFSEFALISPYEKNRGLMLRIAPFKNNAPLTDVEVKITLALQITKNDKTSFEFFNLALEIDKVNTLPLSWTIVHPIDEDSPLYNFNENDFNTIKGEIIVFIKAFDETFSNNVIARASYTFKEFIYGRKFVPMYNRDMSGSTTVIDLSKLNNTTVVQMPL